MLYKPTIICVLAKWCDLKPQYGESQSIHLIGNTLKNTHLANTIIFQYEGVQDNQKLIDLTNNINPDIMIIDPMHEPGGDFTINTTTLKTIKNKTNCKMTILSWDSIPTIHDSYKNLINWINQIIIIDSLDACNHARLTYPDKAENIIFAPEICDTTLFNNPLLTRDIDFSFVGWLAAKPDKAYYINYILANGINIQKFGGQRESILSWEDYAITYQRSKMTFNLSQACGSPQLKGRVLEAMLCGTALVDINSNLLNLFFTPMVDYIAFDNEYDLIEKTKYFLYNDKEREIIAQNGQKKALLHCNAYKWWLNNVFIPLGFYK